MHINRTVFTSRVALTGVGSLILVFALIATLASPTEAVHISTVPSPSPSFEILSSQKPAGIRVEISGGVAQPGVISLPEKSRLMDAISAAGGWGERVDPLRVEICLNLAAPLEDGSAVRVPTRDDRLLLGLTGVECGPLYSSAAEIAAAGVPVGTATSTASGGKIDLNHASVEELDTLPGIGPVTAAKIIAARKEKPFLIVDDLRDRKIISESVLKEIRALVIP
jgi:competence protein ComEA